MAKKDLNVQLRVYCQSDRAGLEIGISGASAELRESIVKALECTVGMALDGYRSTLDTPLKLTREGTKPEKSRWPRSTWRGWEIE